MTKRFIATASITLLLLVVFSRFHGNTSVPSALKPIPSVAAAETGSIHASVPHIPILMYHYIEDHDAVKNPKGAGLFISPAVFDAQLQWLSDHGYQTITLDDMVNIYHHTMISPAKPIILTFDDGWEDSYTNVVPLLQKYQMKGVFFIITGYLKKDGFVTADQVKEMAKDGMDIKAHTVDHLDLSKISERDAQYEMGQSKKTLEDLLGTPVLHLAYPSGRYNEKVVSIAKKSGYVTAVTTHEGISRSSDHLLTLPRVRITKTSDFAKILGDKAQSAKRGSSSASRAL